MASRPVSAHIPLPSRDLVSADPFPLILGCQSVSSSSHSWLPRAVTLRPSEDPLGGLPVFSLGFLEGCACHQQSLLSALPSSTVPLRFIRPFLAARALCTSAAQTLATSLWVSISCGDPIMRSLWELDVGTAVSWGGGGRQNAAQLHFLSCLGSEKKDRRFLLLQCHTPPKNYRSTSLFTTVCKRLEEEAGIDGLDWWAACENAAAAAGCCVSASLRTKTLRKIKNMGQCKSKERDPKE
jgi:hypothetical protein